MLFAAFEAGLFQFLFSLSKDKFFPPVQLVFRGDIADSAMQSVVIIVVHKGLDNPTGVLKGEGCLGADTVALEGFVPAFQLAIALGIAGRDTDVGHPALADEFLEIAGNELRAIIGDDAWVSVREFFPGSLENDFHIIFGHPGPDFPVDDVAAVAVQDGAEVVKSAGDVNIGDVNMPMLMGLGGLFEAFSLA